MVSVSHRFLLDVFAFVFAKREFSISILTEPDVLHVTTVCTVHMGLHGIYLWLVSFVLNRINLWATVSSVVHLLLPLALSACQLL